MRTIVTILFAWVLLTLLGLKISHKIFDSSEFEPFISGGQTIYGTVKNKDRENHRLIGYMYTVNGRQYSGTGHSGSGNPDFDEIDIGQQVIVAYDRKNPEKSVLGYPEDYLARENGAANFLSVIFSAISFAVVGIIYIGLRAARRGRRPVENS